MRFAKAIPAIVLAAVVGCNSPAMKAPPSQKAEMTQQWNAARAGVLGSLATEQYQGGNLDKARETIDNAIRLNGKNATLHVLSAKIAIEQGQLDQAEKELRQAQFIDPKIAEADYLCGVIYQRWQKPEVAFDLYQSASEKAPTELAYVLASAEMLVDMNRPGDALNLLEAKATSFEHSAVLRDAMGQLLSGKGRYAEAVAMFHQASMLATDDESIKEHLALAMYFNKQYRDAGDLIEKLVNSDKYKQRVDLYLALAECNEQTGHAADARAAFETATQISPGTPEAWIGLAKVSLERNDVRRAEMSLHKAATLDPASAEPQLLLGYIRLRENKLNEALPYFKKATALNQSDTVSLCMVGYTYEKAGQTDQAIQCYAKALKLHPGDELATKLMASVGVE